MTTPKAGLKTMPTGILKNEQVFNEAVILLEALTYRGVISRAVLDPAGISPSPTNGDIYLINDGSPTSTGDWSGQGGKMAVYFDGWRFLPPGEGLTLWIIDETQQVQYRSGVWVDVNEFPPQTLAELSDVDFSGSPSPQDGELFRFDAAIGKWVNGGSIFGARVERSGSTFAVTNGLTAVSIEYNSEIWDTQGYHDNTTNPSRLTIPALTADGIYEVKAGFETSAYGAAHILQHWIAVNGEAYSGKASNYKSFSSATFSKSGYISTEIVLSAGDFVEHRMQHNRSGSGISIDANSASFMTIRRVGHI